MLHKSNLLNNFDHDDPSVLWDKRVTGEQEAVVRRVVETHYIPPSKGILSAWVDSRRARGHASTNWKVLTSGEPNAILLKYNPRMQDVDHIKKVTNIMRFCSQREVPCPEVVKPLMTDLPFVRGEGGAGLFIAYQFLEGMYFQGEEEELKQVGYALGTLHRVLATYPWQTADPISWCRVELVAEFDHIIEFIKNKLNLDHFESYALERASQWREKLTVVDGLNFNLSFAQLTHHDLHVQNVLFHDGKLAAILDFEHVDMTPEPRGVDLAFSLHRFVKFYATRHRHKLSEAACIEYGSRIFLAEYLRANPGLMEEEIQAIPALIRYRAGLGLIATLRQRALEKLIDFPPEELDKDIHSFCEAKLFCFLQDWKL